MKDIVKDFNLYQKKRSDDLIVTKMRTLCNRKRQKRNKSLRVTKMTTLCTIACREDHTIFVCCIAHCVHNVTINMKKYTSVVLSYAFLLYPHCIPTVSSVVKINSPLEHHLAM